MITESKHSFVVVAVMMLLVMAGLAQQDVAPKSADAEADRFYTANALYNRKLYSAAVPEYQAFLAQSPSHAKAEQARLGLALSYFGMGNYPEAGNRFMALLVKGEVGDKAQLAVLLGQCQLEARGLAQAEASFAAAAVTNGAAEFRHAALAMLTDVCFQENKWTNTFRAAESLIKADPQGPRTVRAAYQGAYARIQAGQFDEAIVTLTWLLPRVQGTPLQAPAGFLLGEAFRVTGRMEQAAEQYAVVVTNATGSFAAEAYFRLGSVNFQMKKNDAVLDAMGKSIGLQPKGGYSDEARLLAGRAALDKKDYHNAVYHLQAMSLATNAFSGESTLWFARVYSRQNNFAEAEKILTASLPRFRAEKAAVFPDLLFDCAAASMAQQKFAKAGELFTEMERLNPKGERLQDVIRLQATCLHYTRQFAHSLTYSDRFVTMNGTNAATPFMNEVLFLHAENQYLCIPPRMETALQTLRDFLRLFPKDSNANAAALRISQILYRKNEWPESLKSAEPLAARKPEGKLFDPLHFLIGDSHFRLSHWTEALTNLTIFVSKVQSTEPNCDTALLEMALSSLNVNNPTQAMAHFTALVSRCPTSEHMPVSLSELGRLQYEAKQYWPARETLRRLVTVFSNSVERIPGEYYLGWIALNEKRDADATTNFTYVVNHGPQSPLCADSLLQLGLLNIKFEKYSEAHGRLGDLLNRFPAFVKNDEALYCDGLSLSRQKRWGESIAYAYQPFTNRFARSPLMDRVLYEWAWSERNQNRIPEAVRLYASLIKTCPQSPLIDRARFEMSELTFDAKQYDTVIADLQKAVANAKEPALREQVLYRLAWAYQSKGDPDETARAFEAVLKEFPNTDVAATAHYQAGESRMKTAEYVSARDHFAAALNTRKATEVSESSLLRLGESNGLLKEWAGCVKAYDQFQNAYPKSRWIQHARYGSGWARENQKDFHGAIAQYRRVLADKGTDEISAKCQFQIGECYFAMKQYDAAVQEFMRVDVAFRVEDINAKALLELGRVLEAKGDKAAAAERFKEVIGRYPKHNAAVVAKERLDGIRRAS